MKAQTIINSNGKVIIQKLIQVGQMLERGELEYSGAEADTKYYLDRYAALLQPPVVGRSEQLICHHCNKYKRLQGNGIIHQLCECGEQAN